MYSSVPVINLRSKPKIKYDRIPQAENIKLERLKQHHIEMCEHKHVNKSILNIIEMFLWNAFSENELAIECSIEFLSCINSAQLNISAT